MVAIALTGATGFLGSWIARRLLEGGEHEIISLTRRSHPLYGATPGFSEVRLPGESRELVQALRSGKASSLIHAAAAASAELCERDSASAYSANVALTLALIEVCREARVRGVYVSTDLVFDGAVNPPDDGFDEQCPPAPRSVYARSKFQAECAAMAAGWSVVRISLLYGPALGERSGPLGWMLRNFSCGSTVELFADEYRTPIYAPDAADALVAVAQSEGARLYHCGGPQRVSRVQFGTALAQACGFNASLIKPLMRDDRPASPPRPADVSLNSARLFRDFSLHCREVADGMQAVAASL